MLGANPGPMSLTNINNMKHLWACVRETLRMRPPLLTLMRLYATSLMLSLTSRCRTPFKVIAKGREYIIPKGNQVCVSPTLNGRLPDEWDRPDTFDYKRFIRMEVRSHHRQVFLPQNGEEVVTDAMGEGEMGGKFKWVPFGAGRHRCIGFEFAQIQVRTVMATILRKYELSLPEGTVVFAEETHCQASSPKSTSRHSCTAPRTALFCTARASLRLLRTSTGLGYQPFFIYYLPVILLVDTLDHTVFA